MVDSLYHKDQFWKKVQNLFHMWNHYFHISIQKWFVKFTSLPNVQIIQCPSMPKIMMPKNHNHNLPPPMKLEHHLFQYVVHDENWDNCSGAHVWHPGIQSFLEWHIVYIWHLHCMTSYHWPWVLFLTIYHAYFINTYYQVWYSLPHFTLSHV